MRLSWPAVSGHSVRVAIRRAAGMTQAEFAAAYEFSIRTVQEWERGAKKPSGPARTLLRAIKGDPEGVRRALVAG